MPFKTRFPCDQRRWCLVVGVIVSSASAAESGMAQANSIEFYGRLYPEWAVASYGDPSAKGTEVGSMGTLRNDRTVLSSDPSRKASTADHDWSNSYVGLRGKWSAGPVKLGYNFQTYVDFQGNVIDNLATRDGYLFAEAPWLGRIQIGQMDSMYKQYGDRVRMFGITSGNFFGTSKMLSGVGWRGQGETTFHNRRNHMISWYAPAWNGFQPGVSHSFDAAGGAPGRYATLSAAGMRWRKGPYYAAFATEVHRDWLPVSGADMGVMPAATSILNDPASTRSRDQAWRLSVLWTPKDWRIAADVARLRYTENDATDVAGKFRRYANTTWQASAEWRFAPKWTVGVNHSRGGAGSCSLSGAAACSTTGLGGFTTSVGLLHQVNREASIFVAANHIHNGPGARYASAPSGASFKAFAVGVKYQFR